jgi:nucleoside phosphorylase
MTTFDIVAQLAGILRLRKVPQSKPYNLLLSSALSLTPLLLQSACQTDDWDVFIQYLLSLGKNDRLNLLASLLQPAHLMVGYKALARLIVEGYFATILTTNIDSTLEDALDDVLIEQGLRPHTIPTVILDRDADAHIVDVLERSTHQPCIVKLHGSLRERVIPEKFPDVFQLRPAIRDSVQRYLNQDLIIVGSIEHDDDIIRGLHRDGENNVYYVVTEVPSWQDSVVKLIRARSLEPGYRIISGPAGAPDVLFPQLVARLLQHTQTGQDVPDMQMVTHVSVPRETDTPGGYSVDSKKAGAGARESVDVLLVTVTDIEATAVLRQFPRWSRISIKGRVYYDLGTVGDDAGTTDAARLCMLQSSTMGPGARLSIEEGIEALSPSSVIMVGIAFGLHPQKQSLGDILVARQIEDYDNQKISTGPDNQRIVLQRGNRIMSSERLLNRFQSGTQDWVSPPQVHIGLILSGSKVVNYKGLRDELLQVAPEAIGGEMEGTSLYEVANRYKVEWMLVKAICDWADGHKNDGSQVVAAENAVRFVLHVVQQQGFVIQKPR